MTELYFPAGVTPPRWKDRRAASRGKRLGGNDFASALHRRVLSRCYRAHPLDKRE